MSDSPPETEIFVLAGIKCLKVSQVFSQMEIDQSQVSKSKLLISNKFFNKIQLGSCFFK